MGTNQSIGVTLISPLALPTSDPRNPDYKEPDDGQDGADKNTPFSGSEKSVDSLRIEQEPWPDEPEGGFGHWLQEQGKGLSLDTYDEYYAQYKSWCSDDGKLEVKINVIKSRSDLPYTLKASYGVLSPAIDETSDHSESVTVKSTDTYETNQNVDGKITASWEGPVLAEDGSTLANNPKISQNGSSLDFGTKVTGTLNLKYADNHDHYTLTITPRDDADPKKRETAYQSTVYASWSGPVESLEISLPSMTGNCSKSGGTKKDDGNGNDGGCVRRILVVDGCKAEKISERIENIECPEDKKARELADCIAKCNGVESCIDNCKKTSS